MLRLNSGIYRIVAHMLCKVFIRKFRKLCSRNCFKCNRISVLILTLKDSQLLRDCNCCILMVTCDHNRSDSCHTAVFNSNFNFRSDRIDHSAKTNIYKVFLKRFRSKAFRRLIKHLTSQCKNSESLISHTLIEALDVIHYFCGHFLNLTIFYIKCTAVKNTVRSSLCKLYIASF